MTNLTEGTAPDDSRPSPARWRGVQSLQLVHQLNERCIELLCKMASTSEEIGKPVVVANHRALWASLDTDARRNVARLPFIILDAHFQNPSWWSGVVDARHSIPSSEPSTASLPLNLSENLMHETIMFAWQMARWDRTSAQLSFGMTSQVVEIIAALTPHQVREIAGREHQELCLRWGDEMSLWVDLLTAAKEATDQRLLAELRLHSKLLLCSNLVELPSGTAAITSDP